MSTRLAPRYMVRVQHADETVEDLGGCETLSEAKAILGLLHPAAGDVPFVDDYRRDQTAIWYGPEKGLGPWSQ